MYRISEKSTLGIEKAIEMHSDMLFRVCLIMLGNENDAEDAVQETFLKYLEKSPEFNDGEHEKAWLIKVAGNKCKDIIRQRIKSVQLSVDSVNESYETKVDSLSEILMKIPEKFRIVLTLYYIEEYKVNEIAVLIGRTPSAVKMRLKKGRAIFEEQYRKENY